VPVTPLGDEIIAFDVRRTQPKVDAGVAACARALCRKKLDLWTGGRVRYRIRKYVVDLGRTAHDLAFTSKGACVLCCRCCEVSKERSSTLEIATFRPKSYCKSLIEILEKCVRILDAYVNLQFAVWLADPLAFNEEPLGIHHLNYVRERNTLF